MTKVALFTVSALLVAMLVIVGCANSRPNGARINPETFETFFVRPGGSERFTVTVDLDQAPPSTVPVDVAFVFDSTTSMSDVIGVVRERAVDILSSVKALSTNTAFAVATFTDYGGNTPWVLHQDLTRDAGLAKTRLTEIGVRGDFNMDLPEAYSRALHEVLDLAWRPGSRRYVVLFGDAPAHDPTFYGEDFGVDPGRDGVPGTADDLRFAEVIDDLQAAQIAVLAVFDPSKPAGDKAAMGFRYAAEKTHGMAKPVADADEIPSAIKAALRDTLRLQPALRPPAEWSQWTRISAPRPSHGQTVFEFDVDLRVPDGAHPGVHRFPLIATHANEIGGAEIGYVGVTVRVGLASYHWRPILMFLYVLGLLATAIAWAAGQRNLAGKMPYQGHHPIARLALRVAGGLLAVSGLYAVWVTAPGTLTPFTR